MPVSLHFRRQTKMNEQKKEQNNWNVWMSWVANGFTYGAQNWAGSCPSHHNHDCPEPFFGNISKYFLAVKTSTEHWSHWQNLVTFTKATLQRHRLTPIEAEHHLVTIIWRQRYLRQNIPNLSCPHELELWGTHGTHTELLNPGLLYAFMQ